MKGCKMQNTRYVYQPYLPTYLQISPDLCKQTQCNIQQPTVMSTAVIQCHL